MNWDRLEPSVKSSENVFIKISEKEKESLLPLLVLLEQDILFKYPGSPVYHTTVFDINRLGHLIARRTLEDVAYFNSLETPLISFGIDQERYFARFKLKVLSQSLLFDSGGDLFILKRRKHRRIRLPETYPARALVKEISGRKVFMEAKIVDMSAKGARLILPLQLPRLKAQTRLRVNVSLGARSTVDVTCLIRHHRGLMVKQTDHQVFGVEFVDMDRATENKMIKYLSEIETEIFGRFVRK